jgi:bacterioferritin
VTRYFLHPEPHQSGTVQFPTLVPELLSCEAMKNKSKDESRPFVTDVQELRRRAREHMEEGAVTSGYRADRNTVIRILNEVLATEIVCVLRYKRHYYMATGIHAQAVAEEFLQHAKEEQGHADIVAERITQLGGEPNLNPEGLSTRSHSQYVEGKSLLDMVREDLVAERIAVESYSDIIRYLGDDDPTTRIAMETIMAKEEEHADDMKKILETLSQDEKNIEKSTGAGRS